VWQRPNQPSLDARSLAAGHTASARIAVDLLLRPGDENRAAGERGDVGLKRPVLGLRDPALGLVRLPCRRTKMLL